MRQHIKLGFQTENAKWIFDGSEMRCVGAVGRRFHTDPPIPEILWQRTEGRYFEGVPLPKKWWQKQRIELREFWYQWWSVEAQQAREAFQSATDGGGK
jgi:hypothetical protein